MKKVVIFTFVALFVLFSGCGFDVDRKIIEVKNGFMDISVEKLEKDFNNLLSDDYAKATFQKGVADDKYSYYFCTLSGGLNFSVLASPDATMVYAADLSMDINKNSSSGTYLGYYYAKLMYTIAPDITDEEIQAIAEKLEISKPYPGNTEVTERNNIMYALSVSDDGVIRLSAIADKNANQ